MNNKRNRHFYVDNDASKDKVFTLLDAVQSDNKDEIDALMNDFDTKFIALEEIKLTGNPDNVSALTLEANVSMLLTKGPHTLNN